MGILFLSILAEKTTGDPKKTKSIYITILAPGLGKWELDFGL